MSPAKKPTLPVSQAMLFASRFPDEDHAPQPLRRVQMAKLQQNTLPPPSPALSARDNAKPAQRRRQRIAHLADSRLWGFSVQFSPTEELRDDWQAAQETETKRQAQIASEEQARLAQEQQKQQFARDRERDYAVYLYFASRYGALDAVLYCCTPFPGRIYALQVEQAAKRLQHWLRERLLALRRYWIVMLARQVTQISFDNGLALVQRAVGNQKRAAIFLTRLKWRYAAMAFRSWYTVTQRQIEVRWRFRFAQEEELRVRFQRWRERIQAICEFKHQLKHVARRKQMVAAFVQWQEWQTRQEKLRLHLQKAWLKAQRDVWAVWKSYVVGRKRAKHSAQLIQRIWRGYHGRKRCKQYRDAGSCMVRVARGWRGRVAVRRFRDTMEIAQSLERIVDLLVWQEYCSAVHEARQQAVEEELERVQRQQAILLEAEREAEARVNAELAKVVRNDMHRQVQEKLQVIQQQVDPEQISERRASLRDLERKAKQLVLQGAVKTAREDALTAFYARDEGNRPVWVTSNCCVVCLASKTHEDGYRELLGRSQLCCSHLTSALTTNTIVDHLTIIYTAILSELHQNDQAFQTTLATRLIPIPRLWQRLERATIAMH
ncbi:hypothetical protein Poli38472_004723 [Pythium oligandrum]|uniref:Uncharacterized protein n=1 Tax=Pythium oligandrum TaxID=41045 RepID=A0A8K1FG58_PYTOL|nr:hypothetical protein Poli38472_004723 [Pythium oligandrum]|eukprot:TMW59654.1 hypothetical protein Poli38472_004723 [Pythium oligandrum]